MHSLSEFKTIHLEHGKVCDYQVWSSRFNFLQPFDAIASGHNRVTTAL